MQARTSRYTHVQTHSIMAHTITPDIAARELDTTRTQVFLWVERGLLNAKKGLRGTRIHVDARWRAFKKVWLDEGRDKADEPEAVAAYTGGHSCKSKAKDARQRKAYAMVDAGLPRRFVADYLGVSDSTIDRYMRDRPVA